jgi:hypothetical protein
MIVFAVVGSKPQTLHHVFLQAAARGLHLIQNGPSVGEEFDASAGERKLAFAPAEQLAPQL